MMRRLNWIFLFGICAVFFNSSVSYSAFIRPRKWVAPQCFDFVFKADPDKAKLLQTGVRSFPWPVRASAAFRKLNILTLNELVTTPQSRLLSVRNFDKKTLREVSERLAELGLALTWVDEDQAIKDKVDDTQLLQTPVHDFAWSAVVYTVFQDLNIVTLNDLIRTPQAKLLAKSGFGPKTLSTMSNRLAKLGLGFIDPDE